MRHMSRKDVLACWIGWGLFCLPLGLAQASVPERLSLTGLYDRIEDDSIAPLNKAFSPQYPLWTDGALKRRWIQLPPGSQIDTSNMNRWVFPLGTKLWKEFAFTAQTSSGTRIKKIETRYMQKSEAGWEFATYLWNDSHTEARLAPENGISNYYAIDGRHKYSIPSTNDCIYCHSGSEDSVLGFGALQLSSEREDFINSFGMKELVQDRLITEAPTHPIVIPGVDRVERDAIGYLYANCAGCHRDGGAGMFSGLLLEVDVHATDRGALSVFQTAFNPSSGFMIPGFESSTYGIAPKRPERSAIFYRMESEVRGVRMPQLGSVMRDQNALTNLRAWIDTVVLP
jgi:hypothetical protein